MSMGHRGHVYTLHLYTYLRTCTHAPMLTNMPLQSFEFLIQEFLSPLPRAYMYMLTHTPVCGPDCAFSKHNEEQFTVTCYFHKSHAFLLYVQIVTSPVREQQFSLCTFSESYAARTTDTAGHREDHYKEFNSLMQNYSADASEQVVYLSPPPMLHVPFAYGHTGIKLP